MSGQATGWVLRHGPVTAWARRFGITVDRSAHAVLAVIADAANANGQHSHPGIAFMIDSTGYSRSSVFAALERLKLWGYVLVEEEGVGRGNATVYAIPGVTESEWRPGEKVQSSDPSLGKGPAPAEKRSNSGREKVQPSDPVPLTTTDCNGETQPNAPRSLSADEQFTIWWDNYPERDGKKLHRPQALALWIKLTLEERRLALRGARNLAATVAAGGRHGVPDPDRFLRRKFWVDWQEPGVVASGPVTKPTQSDVFRQWAATQGGEQ